MEVEGVRVAGKIKMELLGLFVDPGMQDQITWEVGKFLVKIARQETNSCKRLYPKDLVD